MERYFFKVISLIAIFIILFSGIVYAETIQTQDETNLKIEYYYDINTNTVTAQIISEIELKDTKPTWTLSEDKKTYTKIYTGNMNYTTPVIDITGKETIINVVIDQIQPATIKMEYVYDETTNKVTAKMISNTELKDTKPTWTLSEDKHIYTKVFDTNMDYYTPAEDINGNIINVNIQITDVKEFKVEMKYEYNKTLNQVTAQIVSNMELANTKPTWTLSEDKLVYTKIYYKEESYSTKVQNIYGQTIDVQININQMERANIYVEYSYDEITNQVLATIKSDMQLQNTKPTWSLSEDKLSYTKKYTENMKYTTPVVDISGNETIVEINIDQIDVEPPVINVEYKYNDDDTITIYLRSNEKMKDTKPTWVLSEDQLTYEKIYDTKNEDYYTTVQDIHGFQTSVKLDFKLKKFIYDQKDGSTIKVRYLYIDKAKALVEIISSVKLQDTKPTWELSEDGYKYTKWYYENDLYQTKVIDINGVEKNVDILVNLFEDYLVGIDVSHHNGEIDWEEVKNSGIDYAIIRVGYGQDIVSQDDRYFARNIAECERLGIPYGVYLYSYAVDTYSAISEAEHMLRLIKGHNPEFGVWIDLEEEVPGVDFVGIATTFCEKMKGYGYSNVGVYANLEWWQTTLNNDVLDKYNKWIAQWGSSCDYDKKYVMWQYTDSGTVNGIDTNVDMNIYYK